MGTSPRLSSFEKGQRACRLTALLVMLSPLLLAVITVTHAEGLTGGDLLKYCTAGDPNTAVPHDRAQILRCMGYFEGAVTTMLAFNGTGFCLPAKIRPADILANTVDWLRAHSDQQQKLAATDIIAATQERWACRKHTECAVRGELPVADHLLATPPCRRAASACSMHSRNLSGSSGPGLATK